MELQIGRWRVEVTGVERAAAALALRSRLFRAGAPDRDVWDAAARHLIVSGSDGVAACARLTLGDPRRGYTGTFYDLDRFAAAFPRALEVGRVCIAPEVRDPDLPRLMLAIMARIVTGERAMALHGCASFPADGAGLCRLAGRVAPPAWRPDPRAQETVPLIGAPGPVPSILRGYLALGAAVSDHAVVDRDLGTRHVFVGLPVSAIPEGRARLLTGMLTPA
jgi:putative hemolysin